MKSGVTISTAAHALLLAWGLVSFSAKPFDAATAESLPVDVISATEFSQMTAGAKTAPKAETPKPVVEKVADTTPPPKDLTAKISDKPAIEAAKDDAPPPMPEVKPQPDKKPPEEKKPDEIAEAIKKEIVKPPPPAPKKPPPPKLDLSKIENKLALLDKREQRRAAVTGETINTTPALGTSTGKAASLSMTEIDALRSALARCWNPPAGVADAKDLVVQVHFNLGQDGALTALPTIMNRGSNALFQTAAESAVRAVQICAPFKFLPVAKYDAWKEIEINFDPREMFRG